MIMGIMEANTQREDLESQVWSAIAAFEQIVETIPDDRVSLDALSHAYEQVGDLSRAREFLERLVAEVIKTQDKPAAEILRERVDRFASSDPMARDMQSKLDAFLTAEAPPIQSFDLSVDETGEATRKEEQRKLEEAEQRSNYLSAELTLAWTLFQSGELSQEEYAGVAQDLGAMSGNPSAMSVSVLQALHDRNSRNLERIVAFIAKDTNTPVVPASRFDIPEAVFQMLPSDFIMSFAVMPFEQMGQDLLVTTLNPYNKALQEKIQAMTGRRTHFFLTMPGEFNLVMERRNTVVASKSA